MSASASASAAVAAGVELSGNSGASLWQRRQQATSDAASVGAGAGAAAAAGAVASDDAVIIDLAFDRTPDPALDRFAAATAAHPALRIHSQHATAAASHGGVTSPRSPVAVRVAADGLNTVPAPDVTLPAAPRVDAVTGLPDIAPGSAAAAIGALTPLTTHHTLAHAFQAHHHPADGVVLRAVPPRTGTPAPGADGSIQTFEAASGHPHVPGTPFAAGSPTAKSRKTLEDVGLGQDELDRNPEERANCCSRLTYQFVSPLLSLANEQSLQLNDMWKIHPMDKSTARSAALTAHFEERKRLVPGAGMLGTAMRHHLGTLCCIFLLEMPSRSDGLVQPIFLQKIVEWVIDPTQATYIGWVYACAMFLSGLCSNLSFAYVSELNSKMWARLRAAVSGMVYEKALRLSNAGRKETTTGEIVNLMSSDAEKIAQAASFATTAALLVPAQVGILIWLIYRILGPATFAGLGILFAIVPMLFCVIMKSMVLYEARAALADTRVKLTSEVLQGIRVVKFYGWEESFHARLTEIRTKELRLLRDLNFCNSFYVFFFLLLPVLTSLAAFGTYVRLGNTLLVTDLFTSLAYFNALQLPMIDLPSSFAGLVQGAVASGRLTEFFSQAEVAPPKADSATGAPTPKGAVAVTVGNGHADHGIGNGHSNGNGHGNGNGSTIVPDDPHAYPVSIKGGEFRWDVTPDGLKRDATLRDINFRAPRGKLTAIIGKVGSGKTSLLSALLGEISRTQGVVQSSSRLAFVAQTAWIQNLSVKDNITFGLPFDQHFYDSVVKATALDADIAILPAFSNTEIGEKGINLSGGQKQRVSLSRAMYSATFAHLGLPVGATPKSGVPVQPNDVIVMDDPLSAVDAHVAEHIFSKCILGLAQGKTRVLVTNQLHFLPRCDQIVVVANGTIAETGTYDELSASGVHFKELMQTHMQELARARDKPTNGDAELAADEKSNGKDEKSKTLKRQHSSKGDEKKAADVKQPGDKRARGKLVQAEELNMEKVTMKAYFQQFDAMGGWPWMVFLALIFVLGQGSVTLSSFWLSWWAGDKLHKGRAPDPNIPGDTGDLNNTYYMVGLGLLTIASGIFLLMRSMLFAQTSVWASHRHHGALLHNVQRARASFFDETPVGRVLNRFSKDMDDVDTGVPADMQNAFGVIALILGNMIAIAVIVPLFLTVIVVVAVLFYLIQRHYKGAALQTERIGSVTRSPIFQNFTETLNGVTTIRAYGAADRFRELNYRLLDVNTQAVYTGRLIFRWAMLRIGALNALLTFGAAIFICAQRSTIDPGNVGVALSFVLGVGSLLGFSLQMLTELENKMNAVERINHYTDPQTVPNEAAWRVDGEPAIPRDPATGKAVHWPSRGEVVINDLVMTYRPALEPAIKGLTCRFAAGEKIGIAGRTGSGKSSLMLCMFRMYEAQSGSIVIDGVDIGKLGLHTLRKQLAIIPQDPIVFSGSIRDNLDPFAEYTDAQVTQALEDVHMIEYVKKQPLGLKSEVAEYGENLSVGQCQLLCIARALLRKPKVILMDEATSSIDSVTDSLIQRTVARTFADATVITIAHRLNTIMDADRILVMRDGRAAEFDSPAALVAKPNGVFASMHKSMLDSGTTA